MSERRLRGSRLGSISMETEEGVEFVATQLVTFRTPDGEEFAVTFMQGVELPYDWASPHTGVIGRRVNEEGLLIEGQDPNAPAPTPPTVTHWEQLMKRRTIPELEELLAHRLEEARATGELESRTYKKSA